MTNPTDSEYPESARSADAYPAECTVTDEQLREVYETITTDEDGEWRCYTPPEEWPPRDEFGNVYPIFFTADEITHKGQLEDQWGGTYSPFAGNLAPKYHPDYTWCNAPLSKWRYRYPGIRYCSAFVDEERGFETYCKMHNGRHNVQQMQSAEEALQSGLYTTTLDHAYQQVGPWKRLVAWGTFESLMGESAYEFAPEYRERDFDFSDEDTQPAIADEAGIVTVKCGYPTDHLQPAMALYVAAMQQVQMITVQPRIVHEDREAGEGVMESRSPEYAQLTAPTEADPTQTFQTIETWSEHHLNLPLSRLIKDQPRLLEMGGVGTDPDEAGDTVSEDDIVLEIDADLDGLDTAEETGTDPNALGEDYTGESEKIAAAAKGGDPDDVTPDAFDPNSEHANGGETGGYPDDPPDDGEDGD